MKIKSLINVDFIPELVRDSYKNENNRGNPSFDPRTLFLICIVEYLENLSDVQLVQRIAEIPVLKWFVNLSPSDKTPDNSSGNYITQWGSNGTGDGQFMGTHDVAIDSSGNVYVTCTNYRIQKFRPSP